MSDLSTLRVQKEIMMPAFRISPSVRWLPTPAGGTLLDLTSGACYEVNKVASVIIGGLSQGKSSNELAAELVDSFGIARQRSHDDVTAFLETLSKKELIESF